jgi:hypothetical protein
MHTYFDRGGLIPSFGLGTKRMELPLEKLLEESTRFGGVCGPDFNERNNLVAHNVAQIVSKRRRHLTKNRLVVISLGVIDKRRRRNGAAFTDPSGCIVTRHPRRSATPNAAPLPNSPIQNRNVPNKLIPFGSYAHPVPATAVNLESMLCRPRTPAHPAEPWVRFSKNRKKCVANTKTCLMRPPPYARYFRSWPFTCICHKPFIFNGTAAFPQLRSMRDIPIGTANRPVQPNRVASLMELAYTRNHESRYAQANQVRRKSSDHGGRCRLGCV